MKEQRDETWRRGVTHGEWLKEGEARLNSESAAAAEGLRSKIFELELQVVEMQRKYELARHRNSELSCAGSPPLSEPAPIDPWASFTSSLNINGEPFDSPSWQEAIGAIANEPFPPSRTRNHPPDAVDFSDQLELLDDQTGTTAPHLASPISQEPLSPASYGTLSSS